jgi:2-methylisocitrate lyase-like PEP mutase family enzyme
LLSAALLYWISGCYDALSGKVLADAGHKAAFVSGYAVRPAAVQAPKFDGRLLAQISNCVAG